MPTGGPPLCAGRHHQGGRGRGGVGVLLLLPCTCGNYQSSTRAIRDGRRRHGGRLVGHRRRRAGGGGGGLGSFRGDAFNNRSRYSLANLSQLLSLFFGLLFLSNLLFFPKAEENSEASSSLRATRSTSLSGSAAAEGETVRFETTFPLLEVKMWVLGIDFAKKYQLSTSAQSLSTILGAGAVDRVRPTLRLS